MRRIIVACIPNGILQDRYNPSATDGIWLAGRNAPTLGEDFRVRLSYKLLRSKAAWRVQEIPLNVEFEATEAERAVFAPVRRERGDNLLVISWSPDTLRGGDQMCLDAGSAR